jgi:methylated-DNA-[protein]-cysteine S-methyltransferase
MTPTLASRRPRTSTATPRLTVSGSLSTEPLAWSIFESPIGWIGICGNSQGVRRTVIGHASPAALMQVIQTSDGRPEEADWCPELRERISRALSGQATDFQDVMITAGWSTDFQRDIIASLRTIGWGQTVSYAELAALAGRPGAARAVGQVMARNPLPLIVPCHRVLASGGRIGGFSAPTGLDLKRTLLALESGRPA